MESLNTTVDSVLGIEEDRAPMYPSNRSGGSYGSDPAAFAVAGVSEDEIARSKMTADRADGEQGAKREKKADELLVEALIEEIAIDGMCGVLICPNMSRPAPQSG